MKITKRAEEEIDEHIRRAIANEGCNVCPRCGETESALAPQNILPIKREVRDGFFSFFKPIKFMNVDTYCCHTCGAR